MTDYHDRRLAVDELIEKLWSVKWEVIDDDEWDSRCVFVDMRPDDFEALLREAADALEAAQIGLRYAAQAWVLPYVSKWSEEEIDEAVEHIIGDAKREASYD